MGIVWHELGAEDTVLMAVDAQAIAVHRGDKLPGQLIVQINLEISARSDELKTVAGEVTSEEGVVLMLHRVLQLAGSHIPMVDDSIAGHAQKSLLGASLTELVVHLQVLVEVGAELDAARGRGIGALLGDLALRLLLQDRGLEEADRAIGVTYSTKLYQQIE